MYRTFRGRMLISKRGREWMKQAVHAVQQQANGWYVVGDCSFSMRVFVPDRRRRDMDNLLKPAQDCMTHAGIWKDDCQVKELHVTHCGMDRDDARCEITVLAL